MHTLGLLSQAFTGDAVYLDFFITTETVFYLCDEVGAGISISLDFITNDAGVTLTDEFGVGVNAMFDFLVTESGAMITDEFSNEFDT